MPILNEMEKNSTIYIIGAGPQLNSLLDEEVNLLERSATIGVNRVQYKVKTRYFISAYPSEILLAQKILPKHSTIIHMRPKIEDLFPEFNNIITIKREIFDKNKGLSRFLSLSNPVIFTKMNVALGATHLAFILGAKKIVYIGVEQRNKVHFYDESIAIKQRIKKDLVDLKKWHSIFSIDHRNRSCENYLKALDSNIDDLKASKFYTTDHVDTFREYFKIMRKQGVEIYATKKDSVVFDAGAVYKSLQYFLNHFEDWLDRLQKRRKRSESLLKEVERDLGRSRSWLENISNISVEVG
ncbi:MAG: hypothetical protein SWX82_17335 [Cyanobacteriota bacterium]|nr:hypothetical protein [Cyanobacteriota bacterium]